MIIDYDTDLEFASWARADLQSGICVICSWSVGASGHCIVLISGLFHILLGSHFRIGFVSSLQNSAKNLEYVKLGEYSDLPRIVESVHVPAPLLIVIKFIQFSFIIENSILNIKQFLIKIHHFLN